MIKIEIPGEPVPAARPRFGNGRAYQPKRNAEYRKHIQEAARAAMGGKPPLDGELSAVIKLYRKYKPATRAFGDLDNHLKQIFDGLNLIAFEDDKQIVRCTVEKFQDKQNPHAEITIAQRATYDNQKESEHT